MPSDANSGSRPEDLAPSEARVRHPGRPFRRSGAGRSNNRAPLGAQLRRALASGSPVSVVIVDVDRFRLIVDALGHRVAEMLLDTLRKRMRAVVPPSAAFARFTGDAFVAVTGDSPSKAMELAEGLLALVSEPLLVGGHDLRLTASAGVATRSAGASGEEVLRDASAALHVAKARGGGRVEVCTPGTVSAASRRLAVEAELRRAVRGRELSIGFQPIVDLAKARWHGSEALLRWNLRDGCECPPDEFIPLAEECGLIVPIGEWVLERVAATLGSDHPPLGTPYCSVNLSPRQLLAPGLLPAIERAITTYGLSKGALGFEITETVMVEELDVALATVRAIRRLGCPVGLDDFGTGYSSLGYLRRFPIDFVKLDRSLVADVDTDADARVIVQAVLALSAGLGMASVAEGVENKAQALCLRDLGCRYGQGYLFGAARAWPVGGTERPPREKA